MLKLSIRNPDEAGVLVVPDSYDSIEVQKDFRDPTKFALHLSPLRSSRMPSTTSQNLRDSSTSLSQKVEFDWPFSEVEPHEFLGKRWHPDNFFTENEEEVPEQENLAVGDVLPAYSNPTSARIFEDVRFGFDPTELPSNTFFGSGELREMDELFSNVGPTDRKVSPRTFRTTNRPDVETYPAIPELSNCVLETRSQLYDEGHSSGPIIKLSRPAQPINKLPSSLRTDLNSQTNPENVLCEMFKTSKLPDSESNPVVAEVFDCLVDHDLHPIQDEQGNIYYALKQKRPSQLTNKFHGLVRKALKFHADRDLEAYFGLTLGEAKQVGDTCDLMVNSRQIMIKNKKIKELVFTLDFFKFIFEQVQENSKRMLSNLLSKGKPLLEQPACAELRKDFSNSLKGRHNKKPFTEVENYWSAIIYCNEFLYELKETQANEASDKLTQDIEEISSRLKQSTQTHSHKGGSFEIKDYFITQYQIAGLCIHPDLHPRDGRFGLITSHKNVHFQAYLVRTPSINTR